MNPFKQEPLKDTNRVSAQRGLRTVESASPAESGASSTQTKNMLPKLYDAQEVIAEERIELQKLRASRQQEPPKELANGVFDTVGVCLSGGGIRSGAFCLGAMQALENNGILRKTDYLSTVSGGGYTGISAALSMSESGTFPFFNVDESSDTPGVSLLRQNAKYLRSNHLMEMAKNVAVVLRGVAANIVIVLAALLLLAGISLAINPTYNDLGGSWLSSIGPFKGLAGISFGVLMLCAAFIIFVLWALMTMVHKTAGAQGPDAKTASYVLVFVLLVAFFEIQPVLVLKMIGEKVETTVSNCVTSELFAECKKKIDGTIPDACDLGGMNYSCKPPSKSGKVNIFNANFGEGTGNLVAGLVGVFTAVSGFLTLLASSLGRFLRTDSNQSGFYGQVIGFLQSKLIWVVAGAIFPLTVWLVYLLIFYWGVLATESASSDVPTFAALIREISTEGFLGINQPSGVVFCLGMLLFAVSMFFSAMETLHIGSTVTDWEMHSVSP
jgi:Patatin-like phospholipase